MNVEVVPSAITGDRGPAARSAVAVQSACITDREANAKSAAVVKSANTGVREANAETAAAVKSASTEGDGMNVGFVPELGSINVDIVERLDIIEGHVLISTNRSMLRRVMMRSHLTRVRSQAYQIQ